MRSSIIQITLFNFFLILTLPTCSSKPTEWHHTKKSRSLWRPDILKCQNLATIQLARQLDVENDTNLNNKSELQIQFQKYDAVKILNSFFTNCMTDKGYNKILKNN